MPSANPVVYNQANLYSWREELPRLQLQISEKVGLIEEQKQHLRPLQGHLDTTNRLISIVQSQLTNADINATQDMIHHMHDHHHHGHQHGHHHGHRDGVLHYMGDFAREWNRNQLQSELTRLQVERRSLQSQMRPYERIINETNAELVQLRSQESFLKKHIPAAESFLHALNENPLELVTALANRLEKAFVDYEDTHLTGLSPQVRISLIAARYGLNELTRYDGGYNPAVLHTTHRANYLRLSGFIWDMYSRVKQENQDSAFEKILAELVESTHVLQHGDLPDHLRTNFSAQAWFEGSKNKNSAVFAIQPAQLTNIEEQIFTNGLAFLKRNNGPSNDLQKHIMNAGDLIDAEVTMKKQKQEPIDYHFYGRTVRVLGEALAKPMDMQAAKRLGGIAEYASGSASVGKQVLGGLLIALGVLLVGASVAGFVASFGSSSALSAVGMALGLSLLQTQVVLGVTSSLAAASGIGLTFFVGPNTMKSGQRQGLSQELVDVKEGMEHDASQPYEVTYH
ncbi:hypothetical protein Lgra_2731 [Legionella gratiana]|uniref:Uncharacterized protein n=1 Tax=Legionella gratiana TaxID=45066 RepID=A0A378J5G9_9GAMM|nr:hypothetical protein [Legionella gratiana]KTD05954.1 hypothetical protein Lgra_2731 [Legionella gratiana]STX42508.1 Uncharacterised protein [Legionella gratiana]